MNNIYFPDEEITTDDLYFICYMIERVARKLHQRNQYVVNTIGKDAFEHLISVANVLHCENPLQVEQDWIEEYNLETGDFDITIPIKEEIEEVIIETSMNETYVWNVETGAIPQSEQYGVYIKLERSDVYYVSMTYDGLGGEISCTDDTAIESGDYCFMNNDIMIKYADELKRLIDYE